MAFWRATGAPTLGVMSRAGLAVCALAAALAAASPLFGDILEGPARRGGGTRTATYDETFAILAAGCAAILVAAVLIPRLWAGFTGVAIATLVTFASGFQVGEPRLSDAFAVDADVVLLGGGKALVAAATIGMAGIIVTLVGVRREPPMPQTAERAGDAEPRVASRAVVALVLALVGLLVGILGPLAITTGVIALAEIQRSDDRLRGQGIAVGAIAVGILGFSLWISFVAFAMLAATPA